MVRDLEEADRVARAYWAAFGQEKGMRQMYEAHGMARWVEAALNEAGVRDGGAEYTITVTDTAGNAAYVVGEAVEGSHRTRWMMDQGLWVQRLVSQLHSDDRARLLKALQELP